MCDTPRPHLRPKENHSMKHEINFDKDGNLILAIPWRSTLKALIVIFLAITAGQLPLEGLSHDARICLMIFVGAAGFWVTEAIPPFATGIMVIVLSVFLLGHSESLEIAAGATNYRVFLNPLSSPVLVLFFGGFIIAVAASKHGLDIRLAKAFIRPFGTHPKMVLLGIILSTAMFSMLMSNTATTAMMIAILGPLFRHFEGRDPFKKALVLAVPFAANIGGMGTIIGTPPNAVAASLLGELGHPISFVKWMLVGVPIVLVMLFFLWQMLFRIFKPREDHFEILFPETLNVTWDLVIVVITTAITVFLWLTQPLFHIPSAVVALLPIMVFTMFGILDREDLKKIEWHVLILIAGGLTMGVAMKQSGLSDFFVHHISFIPVPAMALLALMAVTGLILSNFMSHTAAANLIIPLVITMSAIDPLLGGVTVALACSLAMSLPISTPPNAIAFATEIIETKDMARYGTIISVVGIGIVLGFLYVLHAVLGWI